MPEKMNQPWKAFWPPLATTCTASASANVVCCGKGAQPHETSFADGTNVMRLDNIEDFIAEIDAKKRTK
jgi:hypothetical protein